MNVPMLDLAVQDAPLIGELRDALMRVAGSGQYIRGGEVSAFEAEFAEFVGVAHAVGVASGTDALTLSLRALDVGPGDEVITSAFTFFATAEAICQCGAQPVFVDIDAQTFNLCAQAVQAAVGTRTRAILPVHLFGHPAAMGEIMAIAEHHRLAVVEDCAQAFGAAVDQRQVGSFGDAGAYSFYPSKVLGAWGDGGMVASDSADLAGRIRRLANHGQTTLYRHEEIGYNSRLDELQAALLRVKLRYAGAWARDRQMLAARYAERLADLDVAVPVVRPGYSHAFNYYTVLMDERDAVAAALRSRGVGCAIYYPTPLHRQPVFAGLSDVADLPVTDAVAARCLSLPLFPGMTTLQLDHVVDTLADVLARRRVDRTGPVSTLI